MTVTVHSVSVVGGRAPLAVVRSNRWKQISASLVRDTVIIPAGTSKANVAAHPSPGTAMGTERPKEPR